MKIYLQLYFKFNMLEGGAALVTDRGNGWAEMITVKMT